LATQTTSARGEQAPPTPDAAPARPAHTERRRGRPGYDVESLLAVCVAQFIEHGYEATSLGMLARALGISKSAIYHHVDSKETLLQMALDRALGGLDTVLEEVEANQGSPLEKVELLVRRSVHLLVEEQPYVTLLLRLRGNSEVEQTALQQRRAQTRRAERIIAAAQEDGALRSDMPSGMVTRLILGMLNSIAEWYKPDGDVTPDAMAQAIVTITLAGLRRA